MEIKHKDGVITVTLDATKKGTQSKSGKSTIIESTRGFMNVPGTDLQIAINLIKKA